LQTKKQQTQSSETELTAFLIIFYILYIFF